jgi:hypothetical protein
MATNESDQGNEIPTHAELARMEANDVDVAGVLALAGYVGASPKEGVVRLHPRLEDLSVSIDIVAADIVATRDAPASTMPFGGVVIWVARTAEVTFRRTRTLAVTAQEVSGVFGAGPVLAPSRSEGDRLNIQVRPAARRGVPPVYVPPDQCAVCSSQNCASHCLPPCTSHL